MVIRLNGEPHILDEPLTITELLERLRIDPRRVAVERNLLVVKKALYGETVIDHGDEIEIVNFVGGGGACGSSDPSTSSGSSRAQSRVERARACFDRLSTP